jgi:hypothetical protein
MGAADTQAHQPLLELDPSRVWNLRFKEASWDDTSPKRLSHQSEVAVKNEASTLDPEVTEKALAFVLGLCESERE